MRSRFIISESDRQSILSMYGVIKEQVTKSIFGKVVRYGEYGEIIKNTPATNIKIDLFKIESSDGFEELILIDTQESDQLGEFRFDGLDGFENLIIRSNENEFFKEKEIKVPNKKENTQEITIEVKFKEGQKQRDLEKTIEEPCQDYVSNKNIFYGKSKSENFNPNDDKYAHDQIVMDAKIDALNQYFIMYGTDYDRKDLLKEKIKGENSIEYKIVCSERILNNKNISVKFITVKIDKKDLDIFTKKEEIIEPVEIENIKFQNLTFKELIKKSKDENKFALILMTNTNEVVSEDLLKRLNENKEIVSKINNQYIPVNFVNNESDKDGYVSASNNLDVYTIPSIVILKGIKDPQPIDGSYRVLSKYTDFSDYFNDFTNYLNKVNNLIK